MGLMGKFGEYPRLQEYGRRRKWGNNWEKSEKIPKNSPMIKNGLIGSNRTQCAGANFNLDKKFRGWNYIFLLLWCKRSLNQAKNPSVYRVPSKMDIFTTDLRDTSCKIESKIVHFGGNPVNRWIFCLIQTCFTS